jgi:hypothetical protein
MRKIHVVYTYNGQGQESRFSMVGKKVGHLWKMKLKLIIFKAQTDFVKLTILFQGTFKTAADRHKCDDTLPQKKKKKVLK